MSSCVETSNSRNKGGYGCTCSTRFGRRIYLTHVLAWVDANGRLPAPGMKILHRCDNPPCVNPDHLWEGTQAENIWDAVAKGRHWNQKDFCIRGHEFAGVNLYVTPGGRRVCKTCRRERQRVNA